MILLNFGQTSENITVTLNEKRTLTNPYYLFVFTHILTKNVVNKIYNYLDDDSAYQDRYNQFEINTDTVFTDQPIGQWRYDVYEQVSSTNTNPTGLTELEKGIMMLKPETAFAFTSYNESTTFKSYGG